MNRIQVKGRRFGYKVGSMILAFKEYGERGKNLSFAIPRPDAIDKKTNPRPDTAKDGRFNKGV
jgi:hypothetical protein